MTAFLTAQEHMPEGFGFPLFQWVHLLVLLGIAILVCLCTFLYRKSNRKKQWQWCIVLSMVTLELSKDILLLTTGQFRVRYLPFDLCGLSIFFCLFRAWKPNAYWGEILYSLSLPGTLLALLFPNWNHLPLWNAFCLNSFLLHGLLLLFPVLLLSSGEIQPSWHRLPACFVTLAGCSVGVAALNRLWGTNFFFLSKPSKNSPLIWFGEWFGESLYWIGFPILIACVWGMLYGIPEQFHRMVKKGKTIS